MEQIVAYSTLAVTVALAVARPGVGRPPRRITPGLAALLGVFALVVFGLLRPTDLLASARIQWRPLLALTCIMVMTGVVKEVAAFERIADRIETFARRRSAVDAFNVVFAVSVITPSLLNNDAAILLLTPVVVTLAQRLYPNDRRVLEAFVFAVFLAPGVAPFVISNPMNMIVAEFAGIGFNAYTKTMLPISVVGAVLTYATLRIVYRRALASAHATQVEKHAASRSTEGGASPRARHPGERPALALLLVVFLSYPLMAVWDGPIWSVALLGAIGSAIIAWRYRIATARTMLSHVSVDILAFLWGVFLVVVGLRQVGVVDRLSTLYGTYSGGERIAVVGAVAALGSAIVDNHPMSILDMMALGNTASDSKALLAALVGGDIGPRLLPIGSLAGLLWMDLLRRRGIVIPTVTFLRVGFLCLAPALIASLLMLWWS